MRNLRLIVATGCTVLMFFCSADNEVSFGVLTLPKNGIERLLDLPSQPRMNIFVRTLNVSSSIVGVFKLLGAFVDSIQITKYRPQHLFLPQDTMLTSIDIRQAASLSEFSAGSNQWLASLRVQQCRLKQIPPAVANLTSLNLLSFRYCNITTLNLSMFTGNRLLTYLDLVGNQIQRLNAQSTRLFLESLALYENRMESFNISITQSLPALKFLDISNNRLRLIIPHANSSFRVLQSLNLNGNALRDSEVDYLKAPELQTLRLSENLLTVLPRRLQRFPALSSLMVNGNLIHTADMAVLDGLQELQEIYVDQNGVERLFASTPVHLPQLRNLMTSDNRLTTVDTTGWDCPMLSYINLDNNSISVIPGTLTLLPRLSTLFLRRNPLQCDSVMLQQKLFKTFILQGSFEYGTTRCLQNQTSVMVSEYLAICCHP